MDRHWVLLACFAQSLPRLVEILKQPWLHMRRVVNLLIVADWKQFNCVHCRLWAARWMLQVSIPWLLGIFGFFFSLFILRTIISRGRHRHRLVNLLYLLKLTKKLSYWQVLPVWRFNRHWLRLQLLLRCLRQLCWLGYNSGILIYCQVLVDMSEG